MGPFWQGRYKARLVDDPVYLMQAIAYVHLNPVAGGMVKDPGSYRWSGHRQILGRVRAGLVDVDEALVVFGSSRREALVTYRGVLGRGRDEGWMREGPGRLPWWRRVGGEDDELQLDPIGRAWTGRAAFSVRRRRERMPPAWHGPLRTSSTSRWRHLEGGVGEKSCSAPGNWSCWSGWSGVR